MSDPDRSGTAARDETTEPEVLTQLRQACKKPSARRQRQIAEFISAVSTPQKRSPPPGTEE
ncbi:hypothetical protein B7764_13120 [Pantoea ananatis]|nr:hypothetical protein B7764_13120 [Pantoea ananatis]PQK81297.1 hypothetical protein CG430_04485 [Pantoea ananatis]PQK89435.1 hypothetical protein CG432_12180 [Pantoea ananatis]